MWATRSDNHWELDNISGCRRTVISFCDVWSRWLDKRGMWTNRPSSCSLLVCGDDEGLCAATADEAKVWLDGDWFRRASWFHPVSDTLSVCVSAFIEPCEIKTPDAGAVLWIRRNGAFQSRQIGRMPLRSAQNSQQYLSPPPLKQLCKLLLLLL